jgi:hypothetical protein
VNKATSFPYSTFTNVQGMSFSRPMMPVLLTYGRQTVSADALLDTGADINILPLHIGLELGADWNTQRPLTTVSGNLGSYETHGIMLDMVVHTFDPVRLAFAWIRSDVSPIILGQVNFFQRFDVCFFASASFFQVQPKS